MRADSLGLFWQDLHQHGKGPRPNPPLPATGWKRPATFPRLDQERFLGVDIETYDPHLLTHGAGYVRAGTDGTPRDGWIAGVSIATADRAWYFPLRHPDSDNVDEYAFFAWLKRALTRKGCAKIGANLMYDFGWLKAYGIDVTGPWYDVQFAEPLIDETAVTFALDVLGTKYLPAGKGKLTAELYDWCAAAFGGKADASQRANIWRTPAVLVGPYAERDASAPLDIFREQVKTLRAEGLMELFKLECALAPLLVAMRFRGVRVDLEQADRVRTMLRMEQEHAQQALDDLAGFHVNVNSSATLAELFDEHDITYPKTRKGRPSFTAGWLKTVGHPAAQRVLEVRKVGKASGTFIDSYVFGNEVKGRVHAQFHPLRTDKNGAVSGRFASSLPNLQNIPSRDERLAPLIRSVYVPDLGCPAWRRYDYSQIEYRLLVHFSTGRGSDVAKDRYRKDPKTDFHAMTADLIKTLTGIELTRGVTKNVNFGLVYGMMEHTLQRYLNLSSEQAESLFTAYHSGVPFVQHTYGKYMREAASIHYVQTLLGRRRRFKLFEAAVAGVQGPLLPKQEAQKRYGFVRTAETHKALNAVLQGSAADIMKQAMVDAWEAGLFDEGVLGAPHVTVHDELGMSDPCTRETDEAFAELKHLMETCVTLEVPMLVDVSAGVNWGACK